LDRVRKKHRGGSNNLLLISTETIPTMITDSLLLGQPHGSRFGRKVAGICRTRANVQAVPTAVARTRPSDA